MHTGYIISVRYLDSQNLSPMKVFEETAQEAEQRLRDIGESLNISEKNLDWDRPAGFNTETEKYEIQCRAYNGWRHFPDDLLEVSNYELLDPSMLRRVDEYVMTGTPPQSSFLRAVLRNDFASVMGAQSHMDADELDGWAKLVWNRIPAGAQGSREALQEWDGFG